VAANLEVLHNIYGFLSCGSIGRTGRSHERNDI